jgi:predicted  nucleic acid-binding Zn-ribbon protein
MSPNNPFMRLSEKSEARAIGDRANASDLDNIFRLSAAAEKQRTPTAAAAAPVPETRRVSQPDLDAALDMLNRAAKAMDMMQTRYQHVEDYAKDVAERAERDVAAAYNQAKDWEARASAYESKINDLCTRLAEAERRADHAERSAVEAREWLECFYDKIVACFDTRPQPKTAAA